MAISRFAPLLLAGCVLATTACQGAAPPGPALPVVDRAGTAAVLQPSKEPPDAALLALAHTGLDAAAALGPALKAFQPLLTAMRASRAKHPPQGYRLSQVAGWRFQGGAWSQAEADASRRLRAALETADGNSLGWDVTVEDNYGPDYYPAFPSDVVRLRLDIEQALPSGGRLAVTFIGPFAAAGETYEAVGTGSVAVLGAAGTLAFEALNARIGIDGAVERGDLGLKGLGTGVTLQFSGTWSQAGLVAATLLRSATPAGTLVQADGRWHFKNDAGTYPL